MVVMHSCDFPLCCNPKHLLVGTVKDNVLDKIKKGRGNDGAVNGMSKMTDDLVRQLRARYVPRDRVNGCNALAREFGFSTGAVSMALQGKTWDHVNKGVK
jgi:hypothetical protein